MVFISAFDKLVEEIKEIEQGYADHPSDPGGKTRWGISEWLARAYNYTGKMSELPWDKAKEIYYKEYWVRNKYNEIENNSIAGEMFEQAINLPTIKVNQRNVLKANVHLQRSYFYTTGDKITIDGIIGRETLSAVNSCDKPGLLFNFLNGMQAQHYLEVVEINDSLRDFIRGWFNKRIEMINLKKGV